MLSRLRVTVEWITTLAVLVASGVIVWNYIAARPRVDRPFVPIPRDPISIGGAPWEGNKAARVVMIEYSDFECPFCSKFALEVRPQIRKDYLERGLVRAVFKHAPNETRHPAAIEAAAVAHCAHEQNQFDAMSQQLFRDYAILRATSADARANQLGLNVVAFRRCMQRAPTAVRQERAQAESIGIRGTPTFLFGYAYSNDSVRVVERKAGFGPSGEFAEILDRLLKQVHSQE